MTAAQQISVENKLKELYAEMDRHAATMTKLRNELLQHAANFDSYGEMYTFIRAHTPTFEAFCLDMKDAIPIFDKAHNKRH
jgi:hypothetical protein